MAVSDNLSFTNSNAESTGKDKRVIERATARGEALSDTLKMPFGAEGVSRTTASPNDRN